MSEELQLSSEQRALRGGALKESSQARETAEVQAAMVIAKRFPRDTKEALDRIQNACTRVSLAEGALYSYSRGGTEISGPSIRLAEVMAQCWGNLDFGVRELSQEGGESVVQAYCWDLETNVRQTKTFTVPHVRYTRARGNQPLQDPRDIYEQVANQAARRLRSCVLGVIPGDIQEAAVEQCETTLAADADTSEEGIKKLLEALAKFGVTKEQIEKRIQRRVDTIRPAQVVQLRKVYVSLRDGMSGPEDWFEQPEATAKADAAAQKIAAAAGRKVEPRPAPEAAKRHAAQMAEEDVETDEEAVGEEPEEEEAPERIPDALRRELLKVEGVGPKVLEGLEKVHATNVRSIYRLGVSGLKKAPNIGPKTAEALIAWASNVIDETHRAEALERGKAQKEEDKEPTFYRDSEYVQALLKKAEEHGVTKEQLGRQRDKIAEAAGLPAGTDPRALPDPAWKKLTEWVESAIHESLEFDDAEGEEQAPEPGFEEEGEAGEPYISEGRQKMLQNTVQNLVSKLEGEDQDGWLADFAAWLREHAPEAEAGLSKSPRDFSRVPDAKYGELLAWITDSTAEWR